MVNKKIIIGNWKMNPSSLKEAEYLFKKIAKQGDFKKVEVVVCAPFVYLEKLKKISQKINLGAQNISSEERGAFTGEVSAEMLSNLGVKYVIIGHSERRKMGETSKDVSKKIKQALFFGLKPIVCIGETKRDESHEYFNVVRSQVKESLEGINKNLLQKIIIAYEPVWALSTTQDRKDATPADCQEMIIFIKKILTDKFGIKTKLPQFIYGGSLNDKNCAEFLTRGGAEGGMPGVASLSAEKFLKIIDIAGSIS